MISLKKLLAIFFTEDVELERDCKIKLKNGYTIHFNSEPNPADIKGVSVDSFYVENKEKL